MAKPRRENNEPTVTGRAEKKCAEQEESMAQNLERLTVP